MSVRLIKHFSKVKEDAWRKEAELAKELSDGDGHPNILKYRWQSRSKGKCHILTLSIDKVRFGRLKTFLFWNKPEKNLNRIRPSDNMND